MSVFDWFKDDGKAASALPQAVDAGQLALYQKPWCPYCQRVKMAMADLGLELQEFDTNEPEHLQALLAGGGQRMVPCLRIEDAQGNYHWLYESMDIIAYLNTRFGA